jgi:hypothetical protein
MRTSRIQAWYQNPKKHLILDQFSNSPWTLPAECNNVTVLSSSAAWSADDRPRCY